MIKIQKKKWVLNDYGRKMPKRPTIKAGQWSVTIRPDQIASYFVLEHEINLQEELKRKPKSINAVVSVQLDEGVVVDYKTQPDNTGNQPPKMRVILIDDMFGANDRWFSRDGLDVGYNNTSAISWSFHKVEWQNVFGQAADNRARRRSFAELKSKPIKIALCLGGGSFFGHGIRPIGGNMKITINSLTIK